jgi:hypothetical protein
MQPKNVYALIRNDLIEFVTMRPSGSQFAILERRVVVTGPSALVELSKAGDLHVLDELLGILKEPDRAWAAEVLLAAMTRREEKIVDTFAAHPDDWWDAAGRTAYDRWNIWLKGTRDKLRWDSTEKRFVGEDGG